ncbi:hypothetical protein Sjap_003435 [Stephania japonica]|uniref:Uncharacterized protein n=1 Tax=Stephania japonica TaxID=461633 RepID=A0AAP0KRD8_9MAGN
MEAINQTTKLQTIPTQKRKKKPKNHKIDTKRYEKCTYDVKSMEFYLNFVEFRPKVRVRFKRRVTEICVSGVTRVCVSKNFLIRWDSLVISQRWVQKEKNGV